MKTEKEKIEEEKEELLESMIEDIKEFQDLYKKIEKFKFKDRTDIAYLQGNIDPIDNIIKGMMEYLEVLRELKNSGGEE